MAVKLEQEHNEKLFVLWLQSCPSSLIHTHSSKWIAFFSTMVTQSIDVKNILHITHNIISSNQFAPMISSNENQLISQQKKKKKKKKKRFLQ